MSKCLHWTSCGEHLKSAVSEDSCQQRPGLRVVVYVKHGWFVCDHVVQPPFALCRSADSCIGVSKRTHWMLALANDMVKVCLRSCKSSVKQRSSQQQPHSIRETTGNDQFRSDD